MEKSIYTVVKLLYIVTTLLCVISIGLCTLFIIQKETLVSVIMAVNAVTFFLHSVSLKLNMIHQ